MRVANQLGMEPVIPFDERSLIRKQRNKDEGVAANKKVRALRAAMSGEFRRSRVLFAKFLWELVLRKTMQRDPGVQFFEHRIGAVEWNYPSEPAA